MQKDREENEKRQQGLLQINNFRGKTCELRLKNGDYVTGRMVFFNFQDQVVHLNDYEIVHSVKTKDGKETTKDEGKMLVINGHEWSNLRIKG